MKKTGRLCLLAPCILLLCCACGATPEAPGSADTPASDPADNPAALDTPYVGVMLKSLDNPYFALIKAGAEDEANALGVQVMVVAPADETDTGDQADMLETMAGMAVDVIAIAPSNAADLEDGLARAVDSGKIIMAVDTDLDFERCACYVGTDQYNAAYDQGEYAAGLVDEGASAVILRGQADDRAHTLREYGLTDALEDGGVTVCDVVACDSSEEKAEQAMAALLEQYGELDVVCTTSDAMGVGAQRAIAEAGRDIHIVSFDGMREACELVRVGEIDATFAQDGYEIGRQCIRSAVRLYRGERVKRRIYTDVERITRGNAQRHIDELERQLSHRAAK